MTTTCVLGVDAGNTKTIAVVADTRGTILGRARTGNGDLYGAPSEDAAVGAVMEAVSEALAQAQVTATEVEAAAFCMAGVDWPEDAQLWQGVIAEALPSARSQVLNDGFALLWCLNPAGVGAGINVGTGPAIAARGPGGETAAMCFWCQHPLGGVALGDLALKAVYLSEIEMAEPTTMREELLKLFKFDDVEDMLHQFTRRGATRSVSDREAAARVVLECATQGDRVSVALVDDHARLLVSYAAAMAGRTGLGQDGNTWPLALGGGVVATGLSVFTQALLAHAVTQVPAAEPFVVDVDPVIGSVVGALGLLDPPLAADSFPRLTGRRLDEPASSVVEPH